MKDEPVGDQLIESIISIAVEEWRFRRVANNLIGKLDPSESIRFQSQYRWFSSQVENALRIASLEIIDLEGEPFLDGHAVTPINLADYLQKDNLFIEKMIEPLIIRRGKVVKFGTVLLGRREDG